jgi:hypothetical protein
MKVTKTLWEVYQEISHATEMRKHYKNMIGHCVLTEGMTHVPEFTKLYRHFDDVIDSLSQVEVTYEDPFAEKG